MQVAEIGSFHIGGRNVTLSGLEPRELILTPGAPSVLFPADGDFMSGQMYVQYVKLVSPAARYPLLMWHGGGMTGATWETKPDGDPGWQNHFLNAGHDVYVSDAVERGRASWSRYPEIYRDEPHFRSKAEAWELFRFGPTGSYATNSADRQVFPGQLFPVAAFDQFAKQIVPRWTSNDAITQTAYDALVQRVGPCVIMTHSQGGAFGFRAALHAPDLVRGVIAIEPSGAPIDADIADLRFVPHLFVMGDYLAFSALWQRLLPNLEAYRVALADQGGVADLLHLPSLGIRGNSHFPMMDRNSDLVAELVRDWMARQNLTDQ
jgi:pimeloyl-ACP methyl ester carboxylesterase